MVVSWIWLVLCSPVRCQTVLEEYVDAGYTHQVVPDYTTDYFKLKSDYTFMNVFLYSHEKEKHFVHLQHQPVKAGWYAKEVVKRNLTVRWEALDYWVFVGDSDPFCYYELKYDTWWFTKYDYGGHCSEEMVKKGCNMLDWEVIDYDIVEALQVQHALQCYGVRGVPKAIRAGIDKNWARVFRMSPVVMSIHGPPMMYKQGRYFKFFDHRALFFTLVFNGTNFFRAKVSKEGRRPEVPMRWFIYATGKDLEEPPRGNGVFTHLLPSESGDTTLWYSAKQPSKTCSLAGNAGMQLEWTPGQFMHNPDQQGDRLVTPTCPGGKCWCYTDRFENLIDGQMEHLVIDDQTENVVTRIMGYVVEWVLELFDLMVRWLINPATSDTLFKASLLTVVVNYLTRTPVVAYAAGLSYLVQSLVFT